MPKQCSRALEHDSIWLMLSRHDVNHMQELVETVNDLGGIWLVTADHGNCEEMVQRDKKGNVLKEDGVPVPLTSHTLNPVRLCLLSLVAFLSWMQFPLLGRALTHATAKVMRMA